MLELIVYFLALLNPFALFVYTLPLSKELAFGTYLRVMTLASLIALSVYSFFALFGDYFFTEILQISFDSFRIFGGLVLVAFALSFIIQGKKSMITTKGELKEIASEVALPFMVGAGTITLSIILGNRLGSTQAIVSLVIIIALNFITIVLFAAIRRALRVKAKRVLDSNLEILLRINGFIVGAFGVDLVVVGVGNLF